MNLFYLIKIIYFHFNIKYNLFFNEIFLENPLFSLSLSLDKITKYEGLHNALSHYKLINYKGKHS